MYNNDYIITVDENGQPYIAHAYGEGNWAQRAVKYIDKKIGLNGKVQYIYDRAKKAGKKAWGSKAGRWIDSHDAGITEKLMEKRALRLAKKHSKKGDSGAGKYYAHRAMQLHQESAKERAAAKESVKRRYNDAKNRVKDKLGYDEKEAYEKALMQYRLARRRGTPQNEQQREAKWQVGRNLDRTKEAYDKTLLARLDRLQDRVEDITRRGARRKGKR